MAIGRNGRWVNCQLYYCNGTKINDWEVGIIISGVEQDATYGIRTKNFIEIKDGITIKRLPYKYDDEQNADCLMCLFNYYDKNKIYQKSSTIQNVKLGGDIMISETDYPYAKISIAYNYNAPNDDLDTAIEVYSCEWIEQDALVGSNGGWQDTDSGELM